jgi:FtsH-binding integral membrane protein
MAGRTGGPERRGFTQRVVYTVLAFVLIAVAVIAMVAEVNHTFGARHRALWLGMVGAVLAFASVRRLMFAVRRIRQHRRDPAAKAEREQARGRDRNRW